MPRTGRNLADEVGLGKTIETELVIAELLAEGASRVLLIAPKPLLGQWRQELFQLFDIEAREGESGGFAGDGVFLVGRELAGSQRGRDALLASGRFDLCVIDEAHEVFAGIYKRFDAFGQYLLDAKDARTAARVREVLVAGGIPVLLLTATPIQNSLAELWGLVQYVDPLGTLLGDLPTFREVFCGGDDRVLARGQEDELRTRLKTVLQRTLRRQAKEFLEKPFVDRHARLFKYTMSPIERELYDDVTAYLLKPGQAEQARFELAAQQAEKFIEDRLLVLRRRRTSLEASIQQSERKRDAATGSDARTEAERRILQTEVEHSEVQAAVERLERRDDATFQRFQDHIQRRRYTPPEIISLFEMELVVE